MNIGRILFFAIFLFSSSTLLTTTSILSEVNFSTYSGASFNKVSEEQLKLKKDYQAKLLKVLAAYSEAERMENLTQGAGSLEKELLGLVAPKQYKDLHFKMISSIGKIKDGSVTAVHETKLNLESIIKDYSWLASTLSLFIINNFS